MAYSNRTSQQYDLEELLQLLIELLSISEEHSRSSRASGDIVFKLDIKHKHVYEGNCPERLWKTIEFYGLCGMTDKLQYQNVITFDQRELIMNFIEKNKPEKRGSIYWFTLPCDGFKKAKKQRISFLQELLTKVKQEKQTP